jgi:hypothetical protein
MQQRLQTTPKHNASFKALINYLQTGREMLRGLPLSKELGQWSGHSESSSTSSSFASVTSWGCTSGCSLGSLGTTTRLSVCDPVWCRCVSAYAKGASDEKNTMNMLACKVDEYDSLTWVEYHTNLIQDSPHHPRLLITKAYHLLIL